MTSINNKAMILSYCKSTKFDEMFSFDIFPCLNLVKYEKGELICRRSAPMTELLYLVKGRMKIYRLRQNGKLTLSSFAEAPYLIGETELLVPGILPNEVEALTECYLLSVPFSPYAEKLIQDNHFLRTVAGMMALRHDRASHGASDILAFPLKNRLAKVILDSESMGIYKEKHTEMSEYLGVSYRHFLYTLEQFCKSGVLEKTRSGYKILDRNTLISLSDVLTD